jgi:hypothetical protein
MHDGYTDTIHDTCAMETKKIKEYKEAPLGQRRRRR